MTPFWQIGSNVSENAFINALLLSGRYEKVFEMCKAKGPLGWSSWDNPKPVFVTFMMMVLSKEGKHAKMLYTQWEEAIGYSSNGMSKAYREEKQEGLDFIERYKNKYPRHSAFKGEVTRAMQASGLFDVKISR